jgi:hypothetical protein
MSSASVPFMEKVEISEGLVEVDYGTSPNVLKAEVLAWLDENTRGKWRYEHSSVQDGHVIKPAHQVCFEELVDAVVFKLRWC